MRISRILPILVVFACGPATPPAALHPSDAAVRAAESIRPQDVAARIGFLASDALGGRDTPSQGLEAAAAYIASEFQRAGIEPGGTDGFLQRWPFERPVLDPSSVRLAFVSAAARRDLASGRDFYVVSGAGEPFAGGVVYAGTEPAHLAAEPDALRGRAAVTTMPDPARPALAALVTAAQAAGASALIIIAGPGVGEDAMAAGAAAARRPLRAVPELPAFIIGHDAGRNLFRDAGLDFDAVTGPAVPSRPIELSGVTAHLGARLDRTAAMPPNVVGILAGSDPDLRNTYVVFSAHFDHTGTAGTGSWDCQPVGDNTICNGADDNASGTTAILELAEAFALLPERPRRSLIFLAVSGEEKGLLGSAYFADNPTVPVEAIVANINMDMIGRNHPDSVVVIGQTYSSLGPLLHQVNDRHPELGLTIADDLWPEQRFFFRSDHFSFARREIPAIFFFTGVHEDYHRPTDTADRIDVDKVTRIARLVFHYGLAVANEVQPPRWDPAGLDEVRRLTSQRR
jgi:hypothetical protein